MWKKVVVVLVEPLIEEPPHMCEGHVMVAHGKKAICFNALKGKCRMLESALLWCRKFRGDLEQIGFTFNACNACTANRSAKGKTHTLRFHVDDSMRSHTDKKVHGKFSVWLNEQCDKCGEVKATRAMNTITLE